jgi:queuine tRNA-ribosyltransferase
MNHNTSNTQNSNRRFHFEIEQRIPGALGRAGKIYTDHGIIETPAFMCVGTHGQVKYVSMEQLHNLQAQTMLSNGYHLRLKSAEIAKEGGLAKWSGWNGPTLTDSGGFQVMSLGSGLGKVVSMEREKEIKNTTEKDRLAHVREDGIEFTDPFTGQPDFIGPKESMEIQCRIGADIHMAFDELTSLADDYDYNVEALGRTERWAQTSLDVHNEHRYDLGYEQALYGVLQGGRWEDLRRSTARKLGAMDFDGYGLGGAFLKRDLSKILQWCNEELPENKPRHLLGLSRPDDILNGIENGADTFDCVAPTREARHGRIYTKDGNFAIKKAEFAGSEELLDTDCDCPACKAGYTRGQLRAMLKSEDPAQREEYFNLASMHNLRFIIKLAQDARQAVLDGTFFEFKKNFLARYQKSESHKAGNTAPATENS